MLSVANYLKLQKINKMKKEPKKCNYRHCDQLIINKNGNRDHCNYDCYFAEKLLRQKAKRRRKKMDRLIKEIEKGLEMRKALRNNNR